MTRIVVTFALEPELVDRIKAVDARVEARVLGQEARQLFRGQVRYPSELQAVTGMEELLEALAGAEVLFSFWGGSIAQMEDFRERAPHVRWVQLTHAGAERVNPALIAQGVTFTTAGGLAATPIAEFVMTYILMFSKGWPRLFRAQEERKYSRFMPPRAAGQDRRHRRHGLHRWRGRAAGEGVRLPRHRYAALVHGAGSGPRRRRGGAAIGAGLPPE